jgi:NAD(P)-dependent dehydrogenase (short-subunit alcohol dehydrogenase family)
MTVQGLEITVATNFFGAFLLTHLLQPKARITSPDKSIYIHV